MTNPASDNAPAVMTICPNLKCKKVLRVPAQFRGQVVRCHYCATQFRVPQARKDAGAGGPKKG